ncbi:MAG: histidine phosphatase family protein [Tissierellales bacterium]|nr:histidine phosphatase family protein [Tissierellales bacterium]
MPNLYIVRHGQTDYNVEKRIQGILDIPLNENGKSQALETANILKDYSFDVILVSPLKRAFETASIIQNHLNHESNLIVIDDFREISRGDLNGTLLHHARESYPKLFEDSSESYFMRPPNGESIDDFKKIVHSALDSVLQNYNNKNILLVTHGVTASLIHRYFEEYPNEYFFEYIPRNCEIRHYEFN